MGDLKILSEQQPTVIGLFQTGQYLQQGRLAAPISTNQPDALVLLQGKISVV